MNEFRVVALLSNGHIVDRSYARRSSLARQCRKLVNKGALRSLRVYERSGSGRWVQFSFTERWNYWGNGACVNVVQPDDVFAFDFVAI
jgi:hypothetical protein